MIQLRISRIEQHPLILIRLQGYLAQLEVYSFKNEVVKALANGRRAFVIDLCETEFIDSAGIGVLIHMAKEIANAGGQMVTVLVEGTGVYKALTFACVDSILRIVPTVETGLRQFGNVADEAQDSFLRLLEMVQNPTIDMTRSQRSNF